jgi:predicted DNA-binding mobile mystery protein A
MPMGYNISMSTRTESRALRRRQIDRTLSQTGVLLRLPLPRRGWIRETREALGMTGAQLAERLGVTQPVVADLERREVLGTVTLQRLRHAAEALGCRLVYAFIPPESLEAALRVRAERVARQLVGRVAHTMALEEQGGDRQEVQDQIADLAAELVRTLSRELWQDPTLDDPAAGHPLP